MPAFFMEATLYTLDDAEFKKFLKKWQETIMRGAIRRFLRATLSRIPKRTGFLRGSFSAITDAFAKDTPGVGGSGDGTIALLGTILGGAKTPRVSSRNDDPIAREKRIQNLMKQHTKHANKGKRNKRDRIREFYTESTGGGKAKVKILKTPRSGVKYATKPEDVIKFSGNIATFFLDVTISYYRINDNFAKIKGAPWHSLMEGGSEMANWLGRAADFFPPIAEILVRQKIVLRGSRLTQTKLPQDVVANRLLKITGLEGGALPSGGAPPARLPFPNAKRELQRARLRATREAKAKKNQPTRWKFPDKQQSSGKGEA